MDFRSDDLLRKWLLSDSLNFTRFFFKAQNNGKKFVIGRHHRLICDKLNGVLQGKIKRLLINIAPRYSKAVDVATPIMTTKGFKRADEIAIGDYMFGRNGKPTKVLGVYPQGVTDAFRVTFSDGSSLITSGEHLWALNHRDLSRKNKFQFQEIRQTKELIGTLYSCDGHKMWHIPTTYGITPTENQELEIDPYLLGCWLGDGSSYKSEICTMDGEVVSAFEKCGYGVTIRKHQNSGKAIEYGITGGFYVALKKLGLLGNKHIPTKYLLASKDERLALLRGLCDTDGTCNKQTGQVIFCCTNPTLRRDVKTLLATLGYYYTECDYQIMLRAKDCPFTLPRHVKKWKPLTKKHFSKRFISSIDKVEDRETVCFTVDADDHLYCAGEDMIVTHNTEIAVKNFIAMGFAINPAAKFIHLSYSGLLALDNSVAVKNIINSDEYQNLFDVRIGMSSDTKTRWDTFHGGGLYATSSLGQVTGFGAGSVGNEDNSFQFGGAIVIDDPIKPDNALNDNAREAVNQHFETTIRNRVNSRETPIIIIMQRLHEHDLCGYLQELEPGEWDVLSIPCIDYDDEGNERALWPFKHTLEELRKIEAANQFVFDTQYMQNPQPMEGLMYANFRTYDALPIEPSIRKNYTDTADTGSDYLCSICYVETKMGMYVTDVLYTDKPMEFTEPKTAEMLLANQTALVKIESNNGGRGFARNVERAVRYSGGSIANKMMFVTFHQGANKHVRIFSHSAEVQNLIYFPSNWERRWPQFARTVKSYRKVGRNAHDDAPDVLTGMVENYLNGSTGAMKATVKQYGVERH